MGTKTTPVADPSRRGLRPLLRMRRCGSTRSGKTLEECRKSDSASVEEYAGVVDRRDRCNCSSQDGWNCDKGVRDGSPARGGRRSDGHRGRQQPLEETQWSQNDGTDEIGDGAGHERRNYSTERATEYRHQCVSADIAGNLAGVFRPYDDREQQAGYPEGQANHGSDQSERVDRWFASARRIPGRDTGEKTAGHDNLGEPLRLSNFLKVCAVISRIEDRVQKEHELGRNDRSKGSRNAVGKAVAQRTAPPGTRRHQLISP
ncbi:MAG: hypothetical protein FD144_439 [Rhodospirillaceae bacterium]|nr:MAG: hypothetical protein FD144_439 [Rhodospirillaceae bacterium]